MQDPPDTEPLGSPLLQELYGEGYFHGANSGFAREGYARVHATWQHWMPWVRQEVGRGARWLDLGCAYGFLVEEARAAGFRAVGLDASRFAVSQARVHAPEAAGRVLQGHAEALPFADGSVDVVSAFDLLEHVPVPELLLREVARILRRGGLFLAATPDPIVFDRHEPTHVSERVPSWWVREFERAGFGVTHRFFQAEYNCELVGRFDGPAPSLSFDSFEPDPVIEVQGDAALRVAPRTGFGKVESDAARVVENGATVHLLNASAEPLSISLSATLKEPGAVKLSLDGRVVGHCLPGDTEVEAVFLLPVGGHRLRFSVESGWARLGRLRCVAARSDRQDLCLTLPFDLYERYALTAEVLRRLEVVGGGVLDVGGTMGGDGGHLAWTGDFLPAHDVTVIDTRPADVPDHLPIAVDGALPFSDGQFPTVISEDVLEHVPAAARPSWLTEIWRVTGRLLLLGCPWATPGVEEADRYLFELIRREYGYDHGFLAEHLSNGHPDLETTRAFFEARGASVTVLGSGNLPSWLMMQTVNAWLSHPEQDQGYVRANEVFNRAVKLDAVPPPSYRHLLVIDREGRDHEGTLANLISQGEADIAGVRAAIKALEATPPPNSSGSAS